jgi:hypothetical protein
MTARILVVALVLCACPQPPPPPTSTAQVPPAAKPEPAKTAAETPAPPPSGGVTQPHVPPELDKRGGELLRANLIDRRVDPFYLQGDFDGDGAQDYVVSLWRDHQITDRAPQLVVLRGIAGEGRDLWLTDDAELSVPARDSWRLHPRATPVPAGHDGKPGPKLLGDAFVVARNESSSALIYWTGTRFRSHFLSD